MKKTTLYLLCLCTALPAAAQQLKPEKVKTTFQTAREWRPTLDNRADAAMIYGVGGNPSDRARRLSFEERVQSWRDRGYTTHFMTGIAWGEYQDYFTGDWDGRWHLDEGQVQRSGDTIWHGHLVPYIVPSHNYLEYLKQRHVKRVIDAGIDAIFMEEPEFWARAGYSEAFKREWKEFYGFDWRPQHESPENTYLSNKLKYHLYYRALNEVFTFAKEYGRSKGMDIKCYVPTHSLVNYAQWQIVSPEASLASLPCVDGYIAQVWTGTSREPNYFDGQVRERVFETAFLEYGSMESMTAPTGRKMFFLTDPIEDWPRDWDDYKRNYQATFTAQLLYPQIADYEVMPWPERVYEGLYRVSAESQTKARIPKPYATQMQVMINTLNDMPATRTHVSGSRGIAVLMANSLMFQRFPVHTGYEDPQLANFYGQALPLLKRGVPVRIAHLENLGYSQALDEVDILLMTYSNMKPLEPEAHEHLARWVEQGGILVYSGRDDDPFQSVREWWNTEGRDYAAPADHLFERLGLGRAPAAGEYACRKGIVRILRHDPKEYVLAEGGDKAFVETVNDLYARRHRGQGLQFKNHFRLERGPYDLIAVVDEGVSDEPYRIEGTLIDIYDPQLPVYHAKELRPGEQGLFLNVDRIRDGKRPRVLASASRIYDEQRTGRSYSFLAKGPIETTSVARVLLPARPVSLKIGDRNIQLADADWDARSRTCRIRFENDPDGVQVAFAW